MKIFAALRSRNLILLWSGQLISQLGDLIIKIALPFYIYQLTRSALDTGLMFIVETVPIIFLGSLAGVLVDRWDRRWLMIIVDSLRAVLLLLLLFVHSSALLWLIYLVACLQSCLTLFFEPAYNALLPSLVSDEAQLTAVNSLTSLSDSITSLIGPLIGGVLFAAFHLTGVVVLDCISFMFSAFMVLLLIMPRSGSRQPSVEEGRELWREWLDGVSLIRGKPIVSMLVITSGILFLSQGILNVIIIAFVQGTLHGDAAAYGLLVTMQGVGTLIGSLGAIYVRERIKPAYLLSGCLGIAGVCLLLWASFPSLLLGFCLLPAIGFFIVTFSVIATTMLQTSVVSEFRGRLFGVFNAVNAVMLLLGLMIVSFFGNLLGATTFLFIAALLIMGVSILPSSSAKHMKTEKLSESI
ncbi:MFS transporter [Ktedonosporobacter rubrisoli]|uniref:MFS transporter n=1 Tax=Ktedonosporobacter rubrisoli TaxID=2509675 RepID=A0A4P6JQ54_KTERU|nr:MFS transporter [Ktedonosporobacter rubrisoli]QBD77242.1 MFS transporter [Ktedonosporobacter rubrisoli]